MTVELEKVKSNEKFRAFLMMKKGFLPTYLKYFDKISPVLQPYSKFSAEFCKDNHILYWIVYDGIRVGEIEIVLQENFIHISNLFVLKKYQNMGIAQQAIKILENNYSDYRRWHLFTIKQEKANCHLYEKLGYISTDEEKRINKKMTIVGYKKSL